MLGTQQGAQDHFFLLPSPLVESVDRENWWPCRRREASSRHLVLVIDKRIISEALASSMGKTLTSQCFGKPQAEPSPPGISVAQPYRTRHARPAQERGLAVAGELPFKAALYVTVSQHGQYYE